MNAKARKRLRHRKYDLASHRRTRKEFAPLVAAGLVNCARCGELIVPGTPWDLGHADDGLGYNGPEHAYCNRSAPHRCVTSREWQFPLARRLDPQKDGSLNSQCESADSCCVFDMAYFGATFADRVQEFSQEHDNAHVRLEVVTANGERLDALQLRADETGTSISTRDDRLVFLPYSLIAYLEFAILRDHRVPGFRLSVGSEGAASSLPASLAALSQAAPPG